MHHKNRICNMYGILGVLVAFSVLLQGCLAAAIPLALGAQAFTAYKTIQLTTGEGEVQIGFKRETYTPEEKTALAQIRSLAILPLSSEDTVMEVSMAETLSKAGRFEVITPATVLSSQSKGIGAVNFNALTQTEKSDVIRRMCKDLNADGLVFANLVGSEISTNAWSFSRPNTTYTIEMNIYSSQKDRIIIVDNIQARIVIGGSKNMTDAREADRILGAALAERIQTAAQ